MERHRRCEACNSHATTPCKTHPYLKRKSTSDIALSKSTSSSRPISRSVSSTDILKTEAETKYVTDSDAGTSASVVTDPDLETENMRLEERVEAAHRRVSDILVEARKHLVTPAVAPEQNAAEEKIETDAAFESANEYEKTEEVLKGMARSKDRLLQGAIEAVDNLYVTNTAKDPPATPCQPSDTNPAQTKERKEQIQPLPHLPIDSSTDNEPQNPAMSEPEATSLPPLLPPPAPKVSHMRAVGKKDNSESLSPVRAPRKANQAPRKGEWHTLWSCDFNANW